MMVNRGKRKPVALITGFLGSGKTTLMNRLIKRYADRRIAWVVNEFGALDIDGAFLQDGNPEVKTVLGGSIFCRCVATSFMRIMGDIAGAARSGKIDGVIIEASGTARPDVFGRTLAEFKMDDVLKPASVSVVVDPTIFLTVRKVLPAVDVQVRCANYVLLNKADITDPELLEEARQVADTLAPQAEKWPCTQSAPEPDVLMPVTRPTVEGTWSDAPDLAFPRFSVEPPGIVDDERLCRELEAISRTLYRAKGILLTQKGWVLLDWTPTSTTVRPYTGIPLQYSRLVIIARQEFEGAAQNLVKAVAEGRFTGG